MSPRRQLQAFYNREAELGLRTSLSPLRNTIRQQFMEQLALERCHSVVDFGSGPGLDGRGFVAAGHRYVGLDIAHANCVAAATDNLAVMHGSVLNPPFRPGSFDAGWSMSTLMHLSVTDSVHAAKGMARSLKAGAPLMVGLWGGETETVWVDENTIQGRSRQFHQRTPASNREILAHAGTVEHETIWESKANSDEHYQLFLIRTFMKN